MATTPKGFTVPCPCCGNTKRAVPKRPITIRQEQCSMSSRSICILDEPIWEGCELCPNRRFIVKLEKIGEPEDFLWLDSLIRRLKVILGPTEIVGRWAGHCCQEHLSMFEGEKLILVRVCMCPPPEVLGDTELGEKLLDVIADEARKAGKHEIVHVDDTAVNEFTLALRRRGREG